MASSMRPGWAVFLSVSVTCVALSPANQDEDVSPSNRSASHTEGKSGDASPPLEIAWAPPGARVERYRYNPSTGEGEVVEGGLPPVEPVYSNQPEPVIYIPSPWADVVFGDDITTITVDGCDIGSYSVRVTGGGDGSGPGFTTSFALYYDCPSEGGHIIPGTEGSYTSMHDGVVSIEVDLSASQISVDKHFWIGVSFDREGPGWFVGTPANLGYTADVYDLPFTPCTANFAGTDLYAGFDAQVACLQPAEIEFAAYRNNDLSGTRYQVPPAAWIVDDVELITNACVLTSLEIGALSAGTGGVTVTAELRSQCEPATVIPATQTTGVLPAHSTPYFVRTTFPGGVDLGGGRNYWVAYQFDRTSDAIFSGRASLGFTADSFGIQNELDTCDLLFFGGGVPYGGLAINVYCQGQAPPGVCCDRTGPGPVACLDIPAAGCVGTGMSWVPYGVCQPDGSPCNLGACCTPPNAPMGETCVNMPQAECEAITDEHGIPAEWQGPAFCGDPGQHCPRWMCRLSEGACDLPNGTPGCEVPACCDQICSQDPYCCNVEWDNSCAALAVGPGGCDGIPASNDDCYDPDPLRGAVVLNKCTGNSAPCESDADCLTGETCEASGSTSLRNDGATGGTAEGFCCHPDEPATPGFGGVWAKFKASGNCATLATCGTQDARASDALLQVFRATDHSSEEAACNSLVPIGCGDVSDCYNPELAYVTVYDLTIGETYYVLLAAKSIGTAGSFLLTLTTYETCSVSRNPYCAPGAVEWLDPPDGVVDARQPHDLNDPGQAMGIDTLTILGPVGSQTNCWSVCSDGVPGAVVGVEPHADCTSTLSLAEPIAAGAVTQVTYTATRSTASFTSHPANADASSVADPSDIIALIDMLNQIVEPPWGHYSCDMDHSGVCDPSDIIRLIDLLNGAGTFAPWFGTQLPTTAGDCP